jgi:CRISPR-associated protein Csb1
MLETLAMWEIRSALDRGLRLRTMCDLAPIDPDSIPLPSLDELERALPALVDASAAELGGETVHRIVWSPPTKKAKGKAKGEGTTEAGE